MSSGRRGFPTFGQGFAVLLVTIGSQLTAGIVFVIVNMALHRKYHDTLSLFFTLWCEFGSAMLVLVWASAARHEPLRLLLVPKPLAPVPLVLALVATLGADIVLSEVDNWGRACPGSSSGVSSPGSSRGRGRSSRRSRATY